MTANQNYDGCLTGNCKFCCQNTDCVLLAVLQKVTNLENTIEQKSGQSA